jgi:hypothetical protein
MKFKFGDIVKFSHEFYGKGDGMVVDYGIAKENASGEILEYKYLIRICPNGANYREIWFKEHELI